LHNYILAGFDENKFLNYAISSFILYFYNIGEILNKNKQKIKIRLKKPTFLIILEKVRLF